MAEMSDQSLHRPRCRVAERANGVALHLVAHVEQHIDLGLLRLAFGHAFEYPPHPAGSLATRRVLTTGFMLVEIREAGDGADDIGRFIHAAARAAAYHAGSL